MNNYKFIINADDYGRDKETIKNINKLIKLKKLDAVSTFVNFEKNLSFLSNESKKNLKVNLHLNLTEGRPISNSPIVLKYLCNEEKKFKYSAIRYIFISFFKNKNIKKALSIEIASQIKLFKKKFNKLNIDGHQHVHFIPIIFFQILSLSKKYKINFFRNSNENFYPILFLSFKKYYFFNIFKLIFLNFMSYFIKKYLLKNKISFNDKVVGILNSGNLNENLLKIIKKRLIFNRNYIFILHPGYKDKKNKSNNLIKYYYKKERKIEFQLIKKIKKIL